VSKRASLFRWRQGKQGWHAPSTRCMRISRQRLFGSCAKVRSSRRSPCERSLKFWIGKKHSWSVALLHAAALLHIRIHPMATTINLTGLNDFGGHIVPHLGMAAYWQMVLKKEEKHPLWMLENKIPAQTSAKQKEKHTLHAVLRAFDNGSPFAKTEFDSDTHTIIPFGEQGPIVAEPRILVENFRKAGNGTPDNPYRVEFDVGTHVAKDGTVTWGDVSGTPRFDGVCNLLIFFRDMQPSSMDDKPSFMINAVKQVSLCMETPDKGSVALLLGEMKDGCKIHFPTIGFGNTRTKGRPFMLPTASLSGPLVLRIFVHDKEHLDLAWTRSRVLIDADCVFLRSDMRKLVDEQGFRMGFMTATSVHKPPKGKL